MQVDEVSDKQNGADARETGNTYLKAMRNADWDDGSVIARMVKESVFAVYLRVFS